MTDKPTRADVLGALARGYCYDPNMSKQLDSDLLNKQAGEIMALLAAPQPSAEQVREACALCRDSVQILPGQMPDDLWGILHDDRELIAQTMRLLVLQTIDEYEQAIRALDLAQIAAPQEPLAKSAGLSPVNGTDTPGEKEVTSASAAPELEKLKAERERCAKVMQQTPDDCMRACVATLFCCAISDTPQLNTNDWIKELRTWARTRGFGFVAITVPSEEVFKESFSAGLLIVSGKSVRGRDHAVIYKDGELWHDPHPKSTGIVSVEMTHFFYALDPLSIRALPDVPNNEPQPCPNGCGPLWRITEREAGNDLCNRLETLQAERDALVKEKP